MSDLIDRSPNAAPPMEELSEELRSSMARSILRLTHSNLIKEEESLWGDPKISRIPEHEFTGEHLEQSARVQEILTSVGGLLEEAASLFKSVSGEEPASYQLTSYAVDLAIKKSIDLQESGDKEKSSQLIRDALVLCMLDESREGKSARHIARELVAQDMGTELLDGIKSLDGLVALAGYDESRSVDIAGALWEAQPLIIIATDTVFDDRFHHTEYYGDYEKITPEDSRFIEKTREELAPADLMALAAMHQKKGDIDTAKSQAEEGLDKIFEEFNNTSVDVSEITFCITNARNIYNLDNEKNDVLGSSLEKLRSLRLPGSQYRINSVTAANIDLVVCNLVRSGEYELAKELISSTTRDVSYDSESGRGNLNWYLQFIEPKPNDVERIYLESKLIELHKQKVIAFKEIMTENGASEETINNILESAIDPDSALYIPKEFWDKFNELTSSPPGLYYRKNQHLVNLIERTELLNLKDASDIALVLIEHEALDVNLIEALENRISFLNTTKEKNEYIISFVEAVDLAKEISDKLYKENRDIWRPVQEHELLRQLNDFKDPKKALELAIKLFGDQAINSIRKMNSIFDFEVNYSDKKLIVIPDGTLEMVDLISSSSGNPQLSLANAEFLTSLIRNIPREEAVAILSTIASSEILMDIQNKVGANLVERFVIEHNSEDALDAIKKLEVLFSTEPFVSLREFIGPKNEVAFVTEILKKNNPEEYIRRILNVYMQTDFIQEKIEGIDYFSHTESWEMFIDALSKSEDPSLIRQMVLRRLTLSIGESPEQAIRIFSEILPDASILESNKLNTNSLISLLYNSRSTRGFPSPNPAKLKNIIIDQAQRDTYIKLFDYIQTGNFSAAEELLGENIGIEVDTKELPEIVQKLKEEADSYNEQHKKSKSWLRDYSAQNIKAVKLIEAWKARSLAISKGVKDNPREILNFVANSGILTYYASLKVNGQTDITETELDSANDVAIELGSRYSPATSFNAITRRLHFQREKGQYPKKIISPDIREVRVAGRSYKTEILSETDPRGFTIGYDTGCCMTLGGASESCIWAGYEDERYMFFAVYEDGRLRAQSVLYVVESGDEKILVVDNIETNEGTDLSAIAEVYKDSLVDIINSQGITGITSIHIGVGYTPDEALSKLPVAPTAPSTPLQGVYTDARQQKLLWQRT